MTCGFGIARSVWSRAPIGCLFVVVAACNKPAGKPVEDLTGRENLASYVLRRVQGTRDGDRLDVVATFGDGSSTLTVKMRFDVGSPTRLNFGRWEWMRGNRLDAGTVAERSVMFLGGQDGPPSIGGSYDLLDSSGVAEYRITIPTTELETRLPRVNP
ncbi:MAG TPA: hypothetical protein VH639_19970 [Bryobacteraceae bacterium]|jgi:hypothetical protein